MSRRIVTKLQGCGNRPSQGRISKKLFEISTDCLRGRCANRAARRVRFFKLQRNASHRGGFDLHKSTRGEDASLALQRANDQVRWRIWLHRSERELQLKW